MGAEQDIKTIVSLMTPFTELEMSPTHLKIIRIDGELRIAELTMAHFAAYPASAFPCAGTAAVSPLPEECP